MANFKCSNQKCSELDKEHPINIYSVKAPKGVKSYHDPISKKELKCKVCNKQLSIVDEPFDGFATARLSFNSLTSDQKKAALKKRANDHFHRNTDSMKDYRDHQEQISNKI